MDIPAYISKIIKDLQASGYEAYIVGGCVRDVLMAKVPKDWDITTNALPEQMLKIFPDAKYENAFGTVLLPIRALAKGEETKGALEDVVEITTYRSEQGYSDRRHPDTIQFETELDKDLERRDFTINALALNPLDEKNIIDLFGGQKDIKLKVVRAVGEPTDRFKEDALRMLRAIRFSTQLGFELEPKTQRAIVKLAGSLKFVSKERIRDEFIKILSSDRPYNGVMLLHECKLLQYILPELEQGVDVKQDRHHIYPVFKHNLLALKCCPNKEWQVRFAALLHDVAKPKTRKIVNNIATFYNHEHIGARMTEKIMTRLRFASADQIRVVNLVKNHMFYYNVGEVTAASVRRLIVKVGRENLKDLIDIRIADRLGSGTPKAMPYKLRHLQYMMEKVQNDPVSVKMLKLNGDDLISILKIPPSPKIGAILDVLLSDVLEDPELNNVIWLKKRVKELDKFELEELRIKAKELIAEKREEEDKSIKKQFKV
ncbi:MAG: CCA tRNA nucleotidyltransferase [Candidatus Falkowbacteria bacterium]